MDEIKPYKATERRGETFSYLPPFTPEKIRKHIAYMIAQGWNPAIEHTEPEKLYSNFWYLSWLRTIRTYSEKVSRLTNIAGDNNIFQSTIRI